MLFYPPGRLARLPRQLGIFASLLTLTVGPALAQSPAERLAAHTAEFRPTVIEVTDGVHVAIGYALGNSILIEGDSGVIIVDVTENPAAAQEIRTAFAAITGKPVQAIIYTHGHPDHTLGARVFAGDQHPEVYAHESLRKDGDAEINPALFARASRQFGLRLPPDVVLNAGIGARYRVGGSASGFIPPTTTFSERLETKIAGVRVVLQHAPGETDDQLYVWLPEKKVLLPGDNFYKAFPNLYAIRGSRYRDVRQWANSLDKMLAEGEIEYLVPSHTKPVIGAAKVRSALTNYRDGIRYVYDATVAGINAGVPPIELSQQVRLPKRLADDPYLQEYYGTVAWSVRAIYAGLLGWFDGNATHLFPLSTRERSERISRLAGGPKRLHRIARQALDQGDVQWAAELADHLLAVDGQDCAANDLKADAFAILAERQISANARSWYLSQAQQLQACGGQR